MSDCDRGAKRDVRKGIIISFVIDSLLKLNQSRLKRIYFATHETITVARIDETDEVNRKHRHVESDRNNNKT